VKKYGIPEPTSGSFRVAVAEKCPISVPPQKAEFYELASTRFVSGVQDKKENNSCIPKNGNVQVRVSSAKELSRTERTTLTGKINTVSSF